MNAWMAEEKDYDPSNPTYSHFTQVSPGPSPPATTGPSLMRPTWLVHPQVVWKATSELGCYQSKCDAQTFRDGNGNLVFPNMRSVVFTT